MKNKASSSTMPSPYSEAVSTTSAGLRILFYTLLGVGAAIVLGIFIWQGITAHGNPDPTAPNTSRTAAFLDIGVLVFREGLEFILVLAAIIASLKGETKNYRRPVAAGAGVGFLATLITWLIAVNILQSLQNNISMLALQAATGLLAVVVLLIVMNWFFHKVYWGGWITMHNRRKKELIEQSGDSSVAKTRILWGLGLLGFTAFYREGFEVVLFLQTYYLKMGGTTVLIGTLIGAFLTLIVGVLTFYAHRRLPYRKMLVITGGLLGFVLLVMVGEQAQEMQLAYWLPSTPIPALQSVMPDWMGLWFSIFPNVETLAIQIIAAFLVVGSYFLARSRSKA